ncbi:MAG: transcription-repair coupling factor [Desulfobacterales bacterium]|nr:MAG: transcription-repair coupling factor [Desulfobacterales bacterium]
MSTISTKKEPGTYIISGIRGAGTAWFNTTLDPHMPICNVLADEQLVLEFEQDVRLFSSRPVIGYPGYEIPPYTPLSPDQRTTAARLSALYRIAENSTPFTMIVSVEALLRKVMPKKQLLDHAELLMAGEDFDLDELRHHLVLLGYDQVSLVKSVGDFSVRGGILDIFPPAFLLPTTEIHEGPVRLDFFGETIESINSFDPLSQRSGKSIDELVLLPVSDIFLSAADQERRKRAKRRFIQSGETYNWLSEQTAEITERLMNGCRFPGIEFFLPLLDDDEQSATLFDYLPPDTQFVLHDRSMLKQQAALVYERIEANYTSACHSGTPALPPEELFVAPDCLIQTFTGFNCYDVTDFIPENEGYTTIASTNHQLLKQDIAIRRKKEGLLVPLVDHLQPWLEDNDMVIICCRSEKRRNALATMLAKAEMSVTPLPSPLDLQAAVNCMNEGTVYLTDAPLSRGFSLTDRKIHLLSENELFGEKRLGQRKKSVTGNKQPVRFSELNDGDIVVHREHGLGIYRGLETIKLQNIINDFMLIEYREGDKLYLPVDRLNLISRYEGLSDRKPKIDKLGAQTWKTTKRKVSEEVWKVAQELLEIYAKREVKTGRSFSAPATLYHELEESFPFEETPGQFKAINDTIDDLISDKPMDRLICGDVGYGKTEVAIRAAFKVIEDGYQVAVLVPTTVLAEQHAKTFQERLQGFPVTIASLNRFKGPAAQKRVVKGLRDGTIDIVIGTHRLLSKDVSFSRLGLLVIDEEHRFGVAHKEKIKKIKAQVDILTLTATPIPRTLQMSLLGIRDLSVISSPPERRRPVKTFVARYDELVIKEAVNRELVRGGQVFVVHNRVKSIGRMASTIQDLVPRARIAVAHGQMAGKELEDIMVSFVNRDIDVLVSTTIIESGLDIPSANTIIINRADRLGLAEIYQLRGRVGRSATQSFAYLLVPSLDHLSKDSRERLRALMEYNELGGGFKLAMSDLQIRGGGNLLGISQSGHIAAIGYDLYLDLLQKTVADLKAQASDGSSMVTEELEPEINLRVSAYIPESYIADISQRYIMYRRISALASEDAAMTADLRDELQDRYGPIPGEVENLFRVVSLKRTLRQLRIEKLERGPSSLVFSLLPDTPVRPERLMTYLQKEKKRTRLTPDGRLILQTRGSSMAEWHVEITTFLQQLITFTHE